MTLQITYEKDPTLEDIQKLHDGLAQYAQEKKGLDPIEPFAFFVRATENNNQGGCSGFILYGCLYIDMLWIDRTLRGQGYGTQLVKAAEKLGKQKGCAFAVVATMDWEALDFYQQLGYQIEFKRQGYLKASIFYVLRKDI